MHTDFPHFALILAQDWCYLSAEQQIDDVLVVAGGILLDEDIPAMKALGIQGCFGPGTSAKSIIRFMREHIQVERLSMEEEEMAHKEKASPE